jgi:hypothetical protein
MHKNDYDAFVKVLQKIALIFSKKISDELVAAYWDALKDQSLATVTMLADRHAKTQKFWPKPFELRPKDTISPATGDDGKFKEGEERAMRRLEEMRQTNPQAWMKYLEEVRPDCRALTYAWEFGPENIYYDIPNRCWRRLQ